MNPYLGTILEVVAECYGKIACLCLLRNLCEIDVVAQADIKGLVAKSGTNLPSKLETLCSVVFAHLVFPFSSKAIL